ncbi:hypothetical protein NIB75_14865 [Bacteroides uniformis]|nr:hypothetical protein [Bacteroides uniformis]
MKHNSSAPAGIRADKTHIALETKENKRYGLPEAMQQNDELHRPGNPYLCLYP